VDGKHKQYTSITAAGWPVGGVAWMSKQSSTTQVHDSQPKTLQYNIYGYISMLTTVHSRDETLHEWTALDLSDNQTRINPNIYT